MVTDAGNSRIQILDNQLQHIKDITHDGDGQALSQPAGICMNNNGEIIITDWAADRVLVYDKTGSYQRDIRGPWDSPWGVTVDDDGLQYVCDRGTYSVKVLDKGCNIIRTIGGRGTSPGSFTDPPRHITVNRDQLVVSDEGGRVLYITKSGEFIKTLESGIVTQATGLTVSPAGDLIIVDEEGRVAVVRDGRVVCRVGETGGESWHLSRPEGAAVTSTGQVVVANWRNSNLLVYDMIKNIYAN